MPKPSEKYLARFKTPHISHEDMIEGGTIIYIETERFTAESLYSDKAAFDEFDDSIQALYNNVFAQASVMEKFAAGTTYSHQEFEAVVKRHSSRWVKSYPFAGFIIRDDETNETVGYEVIGNGDIDSSKSEIAYLTSFDYHRGGSKGLEGVGYECVGGMVLEYGAKLYRSNAHVNQIYNVKTGSFEGGREFSKFIATARIDNSASNRILLNLGLQIQGDLEEKYGHLRYNLEKDLSAPEVDISYDLPTLGLVNDGI